MVPKIGQVRLNIAHALGLGEEPGLDKFVEERGQSSPTRSESPCLSSRRRSPASGLGTHLELLHQRREGRRRKAAQRRTYLLAGIVRCAHCGSPRGQATANGQSDLSEVAQRKQGTVWSGSVRFSCA